MTPTASATAGPGVPPDLYGRFRHDPAVTLLDRLAPVLLRLAGLVSRATPPTEEIDRALPLLVCERRVEATDENVVSLLLAAPDAAPLPPWHPGAHVDVTLPSGRVRQYSLCGDPGDRRHYRIAVRRIPDGRGGSIELHDSVRVGHRLEVHGPRNAFPFAVPGPSARRFHFIAGGIGITPVLPMLRTATDLGLPWTLIYLGRTAASLPFRDELTRYGDRVTVRTDDVHGLPTAGDLLPAVSPETAVYCCGPAPMLRVVRSELLDRARVELHFERFAAAPIVGGMPFEVQLGPGGPVLPVDADRSALDAVLGARPHTAHSCRQGFCGTCRVRVLAGRPEHRDSTLTPQQRADGDMLICVSRASGGRLVLDLPTAAPS